MSIAPINNNSNTVGNTPNPKPNRKEAIRNTLRKIRAAKAAAASKETSANTPLNSKKTIAVHPGSKPTPPKNIKINLPGTPDPRRTAADGARIFAHNTLFAANGQSLVPLSDSVTSLTGATSERGHTMTTRSKSNGSKSSPSVVLSTTASPNAHQEICSIADQFLTQYPDLAKHVTVVPSGASELFFLQQSELKILLLPQGMRSVLLASSVTGQYSIKEADNADKIKDYVKNKMAELENTRNTQNQLNETINKIRMLDEELTKLRDQKKDLLTKYASEQKTLAIVATNF